MTLYELIDDADIDETMEILLTDWEQSQTNVKGYRLVVSELRGMIPTTSEYRLHVEPYLDNGINRMHIEGYLEGDEDHYIINLMNWEEWLAMTFTDEAKEIPSSKLLAACLWEMTWFGFTQKTIKKAQRKWKRIFFMAGLTRQIRRILKK